LWIFVILGVVSPDRTRGADWPQWRGPDRTDVSQESGLLKKWPQDGPRLMWLFRQAGAGYSGPSVSAGRIFLMGAREDVEFLLALDTRTGQELWSAELGPMLVNKWGDGPRGTPTIDGEHVYALSAEGYLVCARVADGSVVWRRAMQDFGGSTPNWGYAESVLVDGGKLVCTPGGQDGAMVALDKNTGNPLWQSTDFTDQAQYSSIIIAEHHGIRQYIQLTMEHVTGIASDDGKLLWQVPWDGSTAVIPTPIFHDGCVYVTSGYGAGCKLITMGSDGGVTEVYANKDMKNQHGGVLLVGDHLFGYSDNVGWLCQDFKSGESVWTAKDELGKGAITCADGMLYLLEEREGTVAMIEASPEGWREHGRFHLEPLTQQRKPSGGIWTHPVVADGRLYLRDQELLFSFDVSQ
jgi:outer membrane protein assembly factor BamB